MTEIDYALAWDFIALLEALRDAACEITSAASHSGPGRLSHHEGLAGSPFFFPVSGRVGAARAVAGLATCGGHRSVAPHLVCRQQGSQPNRPGNPTGQPTPVPNCAGRVTFSALCQLARALRAGERGPKTLLRSARTLRG